MSAVMKELKRGTKSPWLIGGVVVIGGVVLFSLLRGQAGSGGGDTVVQTGPSEAMQMANLQASTALQSSQIQAQTQLALAGLQANAQNQEIQASLIGLQASLGQQLQIADLTSSRELEALSLQIGAQREIASQQISAQETMYRLQAQQAIERDQIASATSVAMADLASRTSIATSQIASQTQIALSADQSDVYRQMLVSQAETTMAQARYYADIELARIDGATQQTAITANNARRANRDGVIGGVIGGILGLFSDVRLKENIQFEGFRDDGLSMYSWNYIGDRQRHYGVMAQEAAREYPLAVHQHSTGYLTVDYQAIG